MTRPRPRYRLIHGLLAALLLFSTIAPVALAQDNIYLPLVSNGQQSASTATTNLLFRTRVTVNTPAQWQELAALDVVTLQQGEDWALLLVDDEQLETLARLRYNPDSTNALETLAAANGAVNAATATLLAQLPTLQAQLSAATHATAATPQQITLRQSLHAAMQELNTAQRAVLAQANEVDSDNDGLTDDQEGWWCTDPAKPDSDFDGTKDGAEVNALKAWMNNQRAAYPSSGKPFQGWPHQKANCFDDDQDSVPDLAESLYLGLNPSRESTDRDKFDDGQELFGLTYCTGQGGFCSYGPLPRNEDWGVIFAEMPSWVKAPGNHPLVAAFPVPEVDVVQSSLKVATVTVVTIDHVISEGTEKSYSTAKMEGTSTSVANTEMWNEWQEVSESTQNRVATVSAAHLNDEPKQCWFSSLGSAERKQRCIEADKYYQAQQIYDEGCTFKSGQGWNLSAQVFDLGPEYEFGKTEYASNYTDSKCTFALRQAHEIGSGQFNNNYPLPESQINQQNIYQNTDARIDPITIVNYQTDKILNNSIDSSNISAGLAGIQFSYNQTGKLIADRLFEISQVLAAPLHTTTETTGRSWGGSQTTTNTEYEEHTVTNGEAFSNEESWGTATAVDSAHAADLTFTYKVRNSGTEYAREISNLAFNLYIGDDPNPTYTYFVAPDIGGSGKFENFDPDEEHAYTSRRIPLSLEQMKAIDLGGPLRIVVEDFTYGIDERFYQDAANAGVLIAIEDGTDDGDETIDTYLIPTWGDETVLNILGRYFPNETDANGTITAIWTPEYLNTTPTWCQSPRRPTDQPTKAVWCKHELSTADWWNVYTDGLGDGSEGFQTTKATPGATALFRFNKDSDLDGFSDRSEIRLGTDPTDATSFPRPELLAGLHQIQNGTQVTATLSLLNTGIYDAYGVEAVMVAPDDSIAITNNTVGGSGRVKALKQVIVGSRVQLSALGNTPWSGQNSHAVPTVGGYYTGTTDRTYTFTVNGCAGSCTVGSGSWQLNWSDGTGKSGNLNMGDSYKSPTFQAVGDLGVTLALYSGAVSNGESFTIQATTPRDTFQYTINREPHTAPLVIVSYNDPQGNHRFVLPSAAMQLAAPTTNLQEFASQMLQDVGVELVTDEPFDSSINPQSAVSLLVNNPSDSTLIDAHLFVEFINISGTVVAEIPTQVTLPSGPTSTTVNFDSRTFDPPYQACALLSSSSADNQCEDYIVLAFLTDYQGNILDTAGRPLSSFQVDPLPALATDNQTFTWDFGTVAQGTLLHHELAIANQGYGRLYTYLSPTAGLTLSGTGQQTVGAADTGDYQLQLDTLPLSVGPYSQTVTLRTSDPETPALTLSIQGTVNAAPPDIPASALQRPLDVAVVVTGTHSQGEWITYTHTLGPDADTLHPIKVYSQDYTKLWGVGKVAAPFNQGTAAAIFGTGVDGDKVISGEVTFAAPRSAFSEGNVTAGATSFTLANASGFVAGTEIFLYQVQGSTAGTYEFARVDAVEGNILTLTQPLAHGYTQSGTNKVQVVVVPNYHNVTVTATGRWRAPNWNGSSGGILVFRATGQVNVEAGGLIDASGRGYRGGTYKADRSQRNGQGEGSTGNWNNASASANGNGGGGGRQETDNKNFDYGGGGGGGNGTAGGNGQRQGAQGGTAIGSEILNSLYFGGGGGVGGGPHDELYRAGNGGNGGGAILLFGNEVNINGTLRTDGENGASRAGGGGAGGSILVQSRVAVMSGTFTAAGGYGNAEDDRVGSGGNGGVGRIRVEYCESFTGTTSPPASTEQINCYIADQNPTATNIATPQSTASFDMFGDGRDGVMPGSGNLDNEHGFAAASVSGTAGATTLTVTDRHNIARVNPGDVLLIHQTQGTEAGNWELSQAADDFTGSGSFALTKPLEHSYTSSGSNRAQVLRVPQYSTCDVTGTVTPLAAWNGTWGGIFAVMCNGIMTISGNINTSGFGFRGGSGGVKGSTSGQIGLQGESTSGQGVRNWPANGSAGGGGEGDYWPNSGPVGKGGGGGAYQGTGGNGGHNRETPMQAQNAGTPGGPENLSTIFFGSGGGGGGADSDNNAQSIAPSGGNGGGITFVFAKNFQAATTINSSGQNGGNSGNWTGGGGGGGGGAIRIIGSTVQTGNNLIRSVGGSKGYNVNEPSTGEMYGGNGGNGRIRIEYCETLTGTTNPPASTQKLDCYSTEQTAPSIFRLSLPEAVNGTATYNVQFGRKLDFDAAGEQVTEVRLPAGMVSSAYLDALVSGLPTTATLTLDIGNDGSVEFQETIENHSTNQTTNLGAALSSYWQTHGSPLAGTLDVPIKVTLSQPGQVLLTNLQVQTVGSQVRQVRLPVDHYATFSLDFTLGSTGAVALDIGDNGSIDWSGTATTLRQVTGNLAAALNGYLSGKSGVIDFPVRFFVNPESSVTLNNYSSTINRRSNLVAQQIEIGAVESQVAAAANGQILEGDRVHVSGTLRNSGNLDSGPLTAAFFAEAAGWGDWYIGSAFIANLAAGETTTVETIWNTTGFSGTIPVKVVVNPYGRIAETSYNDNAKATSAAVLLLRAGDVNEDRSVNIFDLQLLINMILHEIQPDSSLYTQAYWSRGDLNNDDEWNIFDLQKLINLILQEAE